jgi:hypothetical protein
LDEAQIKAIIQQGVTDAESAVALGNNASLENMIHYHYMKQANDERVQDMPYGEFLEAKTRGDYEMDDFSMKMIEEHPSYIEYKLFAQ